VEFQEHSLYLNRGLKVLIQQIQVKNRDETAGA